MVDEIDVIDAQENGGSPLAVVYPNVRQCAPLMVHEWSYYKSTNGRPGTYLCPRCSYRISKPDLKELTDHA